MGSISFDKLYDNYNVLSEAKDKISEHTQEYQEAIDGTKEIGEKEKKLAAQIISKFFKHFPSLQPQALDAIFDMCEDEKSTIRIAGMKTLPMLYKECKMSESVNSIAGILAQLLQLDEPQEYNVASNCLLQVLKEDPLNTVRNIYKQINDSTDPVLREKCIKFIVTKVKTLDKALYTTEVEDLLITETKQLIQAGSSEYMILLPLLKLTRLGNSITGQQELVDLTASQVELDQEFLPQDAEKLLNRFVTCLKFILPYFSQKLDSARFVSYICDQILPHWETIATLPNGETVQLAITRILAELSTNCGKLENPSLYVVQIFDKLKLYMPQPPEDAESKVTPNWDFTTVEGLLYAFHKLARQCPDFLTHDAAVLKDFRTRLMYFSRCVQAGLKALNSTDPKDKEGLTEEQIKKKKITPKLLNNINTIIKDLFYQPPIYKCTVTLSYKVGDENIQSTGNKVTPASPQQASKRHVPITFESNGSTANKQNRSRTGDNMKLYMPPSGKFSNNFNNYDSEKRSGPRFRGRGRGGGMRRPQGRNWRK